jgi:type IV pilus assembly protein PilM
MNLLPQASGNRPRLACEISPQGVVAARAETADAPLSAVARVALAPGAVAPSLKPGNIVDRVAVAAAIRKALEDVGIRPNSRGSDLTVVIPDAAVRVLLLDFDALPSRLSEALPIVRFRLKKMLPFEADDAMVTYQVMSTSRSVVRVLAVAIPRDVLSEYETVAREAGFEPGSVLPSTLACVAATDDDDSAVLLINANPVGVTTAIVRSGILMLHRSVDLQPHVNAGVPANVPPAMFEPSVESSGHALPLVNVDDSAQEWAAQEALPEHGRNPYAEAAPIQHSPYASPSMMEDLNAEIHNAILVAPTSMREFAEEFAHDPVLASGAAADLIAPPDPHVPHDHRTWEVSAGKPAGGPSDDISTEIAQAVSVAAAYYEDTLASAPTRILCAGPLGADALQNILSSNGLAQADGLRVREIVDTAAVLSSAVTASVPRGWLAGVLGALRG